MRTHKHPIFARPFLAAALLILCLLPWAAFTSAESPPRYRALLIACDTFLSAGELTPSGQNNTSMMKIILDKDARGYEVSTAYGTVISLDTLEAAIRETFGKAAVNDVSLLYICTHGEFDPAFNNPEGQLLLSDGEVEEKISAQRLNAIFDQISGTKILLVDACNSGALISKGVSPSVGSARVTRAFQTEDYKVLTSSGASEPSWYWITSADTAPPGSSYFTTALAMGAGLWGSFAADSNRDGTITMTEMYNHLWGNQASSVVQMLPQEDSFPLFVYDNPLSGGNEPGALTGFAFQSTVLDPLRPELTIFFTVTQPTHISYRITCLQGGHWDWKNGSVVLLHEALFPGETNPQGGVMPGRKKVPLDLTGILPEGWTYAMVHVMTVGDESTSSEPFIYASRVLTARQAEGDPAVSLRISSNWNRALKRELEVFVGHALPCSLSVMVENEAGDVVKRLAVSQRTRPQGLKPDGSLFYWNGLDTSGLPVPPGRYRVEVSARVGDGVYGAEMWVTVQ